MRYCLVFFFFFMGIGLNSQKLSCTPLDRQLYQEKVKVLESLKATSFADSLVSIGMSFLGTPYAEKTLEIGKTETLVINLQGLDCTTFVENVLAFSLVLQEKDASLSAFAKHLKTIRYRDGVLDGYPSRLHYFSDWIRNNEQKGLVKNLSKELNGKALEKAINFMGTHRELYPFLKDDTNFERILDMETQLAKETLWYIPKAKIAVQEAQLRAGDIIALATNINGLDVTHTGFAVCGPQNRIHLLHASTVGEVVISKEPLTDYLQKIKHNIGIMVARPSF